MSDSYYLFYSDRCQDSKKILEILSKVEDPLFKESIKYFDIKNGQYPQNLQVVPAILIDKGGQQELFFAEYFYVPFARLQDHKFVDH